MLKFKIVTPDGVVYDDAGVEKVSIPTVMGEITVLPNHIPLLSVIAPGELVIYKNNEPIAIAISGGMLEVRRGSEVSILADTAERAEHIDLERAEKARKRAEELLATEKDMDDVEFARLQAAMEKELARLRVGRKYRRLPPV